MTMTFKLATISNTTRWVQVAPAGSFTGPGGHTREGFRIDADGSMHASVPAWRPSWLAGEQVLPIAQGCVIERVHRVTGGGGYPPLGLLGYRLTHGDGAPVAAQCILQDEALRQALVAAGWSCPDELADGAVCNNGSI